MNYDIGLAKCTRKLLYFPIYNLLRYIVIRFIELILSNCQNKSNILGTPTDLIAHRYNNNNINNENTGKKIHFREIIKRD